MTFYQGADDDSILAAGSETGHVTFWNVNERAQVGLSQQSHHARRVTGVAASSSGLTVVSVSLDGQTLVWNGRGCKLLYQMQPDEPHSPANGVVFLPKLDTVLTANWDGSVRQISLAHKKVTTFIQEQSSVQQVCVHGRKAVTLTLAG